MVSLHGCGNNRSRRAESDNDRLRCPNNAEASSRATRTVGGLFCKVLGIKILVLPSIGPEREALTLIIKRPVELGAPEELTGPMKRLNAV